MKQKVIIMSALPGMGKDFYIKTREEGMDPFSDENEEGNYTVVSADHFFTNQAGVYNFEPALISQAHESCLRAFLNAVLMNSVQRVYVSNTNTQQWERWPYHQLAKAYGCDVEYVVIEGDISLTERNTHGVPPEVISRMAGRMERNGMTWGANLKVIEANSF